ncbi:hypothetical protein PVL29_009178 [Vitis rotundifolia]|uniref:Uncharacterized protein n=1 Tax=Vitis rotundifolia TaxID=103349 RepID=A0AA39DV49_VITRO|nr:hypothetical protein PVL29_009178 [Vitis rotundifolia]
MSFGGQGHATNNVDGRIWKATFCYVGGFDGVHAEPDYVDAALITIFQIHLEEGPSGILVLWTGQEGV